MSSTERRWRCAGCGHVPDGPDAPERCVGCGRSRLYFVAATTRTRARTPRTRGTPAHATTPLTLAALARPIDATPMHAGFVSSRIPLAVPPAPAPRPPPPPAAPSPPVARAAPTPEAVTLVAALLRLCAARGPSASAPTTTAPRSSDDDEPGRFALIELD